MEGWLSSIYNVVSKEIDAFKAATTDKQDPNSECPPQQRSSNATAPKPVRNRTNSVPSRPKTPAATTGSTKYVMPGSLFPRSPSPTPSLPAPVGAVAKPLARLPRPKRRARVISAPNPPPPFVAPAPVRTRAPPQSKIPPPPSRRSPSTISVKIERSPSVEIIEPPKPRSNSSDEPNERLHNGPSDSNPLEASSSALSHVTSGASSFEAPSGLGDVLQALQRSIHATPISGVPATPNTSNLRRIKSLEEEVERLRLELAERSTANTTQLPFPDFTGSPPPPAPPPPPVGAVTRIHRTAAADSMLSTMRAGLKPSSPQRSAPRKNSAALKPSVPTEQMDAFLSELRTKKLRPSLNSFSMSADQSFLAAGLNLNSFNSNSSSENSFTFPKLRKVMTLPNGKKTSELDKSTRLPRSNGPGAEGALGDESVLVDLTMMERNEDPVIWSNSNSGPIRRDTGRTKERDNSNSSRHQAHKARNGTDPNLYPSGASTELTSQASKTTQNNQSRSSHSSSDTNSNVADGQYYGASRSNNSILNASILDYDNSVRSKPQATLSTQSQGNSQSRSFLSQQSQETQETSAARDGEEAMSTSSQRAEVIRSERSFDHVPALDLRKTGSWITSPRNKGAGRKKIGIASVPSSKSASWNQAQAQEIEDHSFGEQAEPDTEVEADPAIHVSFSSKGNIPLLLPVTVPSGIAQQSVSNTLPHKKSSIPVRIGRSAVDAPKSDMASRTKPPPLNAEARLPKVPIAKLDRNYVPSPARRRVSGRSTHEAGADVAVPKRQIAATSRPNSPLLEPKEESDDEGGHGLLDEIQSAIQNRPRGKGRVQQLPTPTSPPSSVTSKKRKRPHDDPTLRVGVEQLDPSVKTESDDEGGRQLLMEVERRPIRRARMSLEDEMRVAEATESVAAAMDLLEERWEYSGSGSYAIHSDAQLGFLKGGGAGGRPVRSAAD